MVVYLVLLTMLRVFGKREVGQFTIYDLVFVLLVANAVQPAMTGPDTSLGGGVVIIIALVAANFLIGRLDRIGIFHRLLVPHPTIIIRDGEYLTGPMGREGVDQDAVESAIREHGIENVKEVKLGVLEPDGSISIVGKGSQVTKTKRRVRYRHHP